MRLLFTSLFGVVECQCQGHAFLLHAAAGEFPMSSEGSVEGNPVYCMRAVSRTTLSTAC